MTRSFTNHYKFNLKMLSTREEVEGKRPLTGENIRDFAYRWRLRTSNQKHPISKEDMISTFMRTLGPTYQLMLLIASESNFTEVINKAAKVELAIKVGLVQDVPLTPISSIRQVPKKSLVTHLEANVL